MNLSKRLQEVADMVIKCGIVADIGCDHAHVAIYLIENNFAEKVIACDVNKGPLSMAQGNISEAGLDSKIELRLSDGMKELAKGEADCIVIAGMGGKLMMRIVDEGLDKITAGCRLILQPQSDLPDFRRYLAKAGFVTEEESMIFEDGKYYPIMRVRMDTVMAPESNYDDVEYTYGPLLLKNRNAVLLDFLKREEKQYQLILRNLNQQGTSERSNDRTKEIMSLLALNREALGRFQ